MLRKIVFFFSLPMLLLTCKSTQPDRLTSDVMLTVGFYNVENFFDTKDDPDNLDETYTPLGRNRWTEERYDKKKKGIARVIGELNYPALLGLCEVENRGVLEDLIRTDGMAKQNYEIAHFDSPDVRGIDVALMYKKDQFKLLQHRAINVSIPDSLTDGKQYLTRDILYVHLKDAFQSDLHVFVNHWPSRRGGLAKSEPKRVFVASQLKKEIDQLFQSDADAQIIVMGDFNDETDNKSIREILGAQPSDTKMQNPQLINPLADLDAQGKGSYNYQGNWNQLDQIILSATFLHPPGYLYTKSSILEKDYLFYKDKKYGRRPSSTYGGPNYYGGISDHLPVTVSLRYEAGVSVR